MHRFKMGFVVLLGVCLLAVPAFAAIGVSVDGTKKGVFENIDLPSYYSVTQSGTKGVIAPGTETVTMSSADPGTGSAAVTTLVTNVDTTYAGTLADVLSLADGVAGQLKIIVLTGKSEEAGLRVVPTNLKGATADVFLAATGDSAMFIFDGTYWNLIATTGTRR